MNNDSTPLATAVSVILVTLIGSFMTMQLSEVVFNLYGLGIVLSYLEALLLFAYSSATFTLFKAFAQ